MVQSIVGLIVGVLSLATALVVVIQNLKQNRSIAEVHVLVNSRLTEVTERVAILTELLESENIDVPPRKE